MIELEELMKLLKVNNQMEPPTHLPQFYPPQRPPSATRMHGGPRVIVTPTGSTSRFDDITDVSGLGIDRPSSRSFANQDPTVIADWWAWSRLSTFLQRPTNTITWYILRLSDKNNVNFIPFTSYVIARIFAKRRRCWAFYDYCRHNTLRKCRKIQSTFYYHYAHCKVEAVPRVNCH